MSVNWLEYKGKKYIYCDYRGVKKEEEMLRILRKSLQLAKVSNQKVSFLSNYSGIDLSHEYMRQAREIVKEEREAVGMQAFVGIDGVKTILLNTYLMLSGTKGKPFESEVLAKEFLLTA